MKCVNFSESNMPLAAGVGNENTVPIRVMLCNHPQYNSKTAFYAGKLEYDDDEKRDMRIYYLDILKKKFPNSLASELEQIVDAFIDNMLPIWCMSMHSWAPKVISVYTPEQLGYKKTIIKNPQDN
jgi:hypothetical protein